MKRLTPLLFTCLTLPLLNASGQSDSSLHDVVPMPNQQRIHAQ